MAKRWMAVRTSSSSMGSGTVVVVPPPSSSSSPSSTVVPGWSGSVVDGLVVGSVSSSGTGTPSSSTGSSGQRVVDTYRCSDEAYT
ncbi:MAG: hypothetical protein R2699_12805 [Acidimicrobiales bacterium]